MVVNNNKNDKDSKKLANKEDVVKITDFTCFKFVY